jgi:hypothetical protein
LELCRYPHSIAATLAALPSMSLIPFVPFLSYHLPLELMPVRLGPGQFEFKMRFRSPWLQHLPFFGQVIAWLGKSRLTFWNVLVKLPAVESEIDCKLQSNSR